MTPELALGFCVARGRRDRACKVREEKSSVDVDSAEGEGARRRREEK